MISEILSEGVSPTALFFIASIAIVTFIIVLAFKSTQSHESIEDRKHLAANIFLAYLLVVAAASGLAFDMIIVDMSVENSYESLLADCDRHAAAAAPTGSHRSSIEAFVKLLHARRYSEVAVALASSAASSAASHELLMGPRHTDVLKSAPIRDGIKEHAGFARASADSARVIYETRSLISYAATVAVAAIGVFLPILVVAWSNARSRVIRDIRDLVSLQGHEMNQDKVKTAIRNAKHDLEDLARFGATWRWHYWSTVGTAAILVCALVMANVNALSTYAQYVLSLVLVTAATLFFLWMLVLWWIYHVVVHPYIAVDRFGELLLEKYT